MKVQEITADDFFYELPQSRIADYPLEKRDESNLLVFNKNTITDDKFYNLPDYFSPEDLLVFNDTKVIQARMFFRKETGAKIEIFCLEPHSPADYEQIFQTQSQCEWKCIIGNAKKWKNKILQKQIQVNNCNLLLKAQKIGKINSDTLVRFTWENENICFADILEAAGNIPVPPYLNRDSDEQDKIRYQTVYSKNRGSVAAPTAGLHFTKNVFKKLKQKNIKVQYLSLHVGAGTFKPVKTHTIRKHEMHTEHFFVGKKTAEDLLRHPGKICAVGTTSVRTLESLYYIGLKLRLNAENPFFIEQWLPYQDNLPEISLSDSVKSLIRYMDKCGKDRIEAATQIMIVPGYDFKAVNKLISNFHQPKSTLLMLIAAFIGDDNRKKIYKHALNSDYRFLSYGDSSLLIP